MNTYPSNLWTNNFYQTLIVLDFKPGKNHEDIFWFLFNNNNNNNKSFYSPQHVSYKHKMFTKIIFEMNGG